MFWYVFVCVQSTRIFIDVSYLQLPAFASCIVLLLTMWSGKRSGLSFNSAKEMADVHKCMEAIRGCEQRSVLLS
jgi:hypothetical protein